MQSSKHISLAILAASLGFTAHAHEFAITLGGISSTLNSEQNYVFVPQTSDQGSHSSGTHTVLGGEAAVAYIWNVNNGFDIGFEFYYDFVGGLTVEGSEHLINTVNLMYGGRVLPGFKITNNTKVYVDLGYNLMDTTMDVSNGHTRGYVDTTKDFNNEGAFQYGAGVETMMYKNLGLRLAYTVQQNSEMKFESDDSARYYTATPTVYNFFFGLSYHFPW